uniref:Serine/threonine-protein phosphatase 4 regulatory subunit 3-like central domain-containing protein n=2 Tax=Kalanchoe fedtschenkoi TaxID=63787 RepID=A0A7N0T7L8_KALFE
MGAQEKPPTATNSMQRVKVYRLNDDGKWDDQGTGHVTLDYVEHSEDLGLVVFDEDNNETLLVHRISSENIYRKQEDTIISWRETTHLSNEMALSFQEASGCSFIWDHIGNVQRNLQFASINTESFHNINIELQELPAVELSTLPLILKTFAESGSADQIRLVELIHNDQGFLQKLMDLFKVCEDLENIDDLHMIYRIVKGLIMLNSTQIFDKIFSDELFMDIIGSLEYDPTNPKIHSHRTFLKDHVVFKEAIPIKDPTVLSKIHQTYRVGYLKDVILPRALDDATISTLNSIIHSNNSLVVSLLKDDNAFIQELFAKLKSSSVSMESKKNMVSFLYEFCSLSKSLPMVQQIRLFRDLINEGIYDVVCDALQSSNKRLMLTGTDILILFLNQDASLLRSYVVRQEGSHLIGLLVKGMVTDFGEDMHCQFLEILRSLLDSYSLTGPQRDNITEVFYEKHLSQLIDVIVSSCPMQECAQSISRSANSDEHHKTNCRKPEILLNVCELLCFCVLHHPYRIKCNFLLNNVIDKVLYLTRRREKYLVVAAVRFVRTILSRPDENMVTHFVKHNLLKPIVEAFVVNGDHYNLLNSTVLDLFEHVHKENLKPLIKYLVESFWDKLVNFEHFAPVQSLKVKYEQLLENGGTKDDTDSLETRKRGDERALEKEEEEYFNEDSDEEDTTSARMPNSNKSHSRPCLLNGIPASTPSLSTKHGGLVDYDDDDDDEEYRPPPRKHPETSEADDNIVESIRMKRKLLCTEKDSGLAKKQRMGKNVKSKDNVFAALCSTLSQAVLPGKKTANTVQIVVNSEKKGGNPKDEMKLQEGQSAKGKTATKDNKTLLMENHNDKELLFVSNNDSSALSNSPENGQASDDQRVSGDECVLVSPRTSPDMVINGS